MFFRFPCHKIAVILDHHLACVAGSKMVDGREGGRVPIPNLPPISLPCLIHLDAYCTYHAGYPLILACNAEMPTSGDLNSGVSLFFTTQTIKEENIAKAAASALAAAAVKAKVTILTAYIISP